MDDGGRLSPGAVGGRPVMKPPGVRCSVLETSAGHGCGVDVGACGIVGCDQRGVAGGGGAGAICVPCAILVPMSRKLHQGQCFASRGTVL